MSRVFRQQLIIHFFIEFMYVFVFCVVLMRWVVRADEDVIAHQIIMAVIGMMSPARRLIQIRVPK